MNRELHPLQVKYPQIGSPRCGISLPDGWNNLVDTLINDLTSLPGITIQVEQIKEKFGSLRFYYSVLQCDLARSKRIASALVRQAEVESAYICETCGERGYIRNDLGWVRSLCKTHYEEIPEGNKRPKKQAVVIDETGVSLVNEE